MTQDRRAELLEKIDAAFAGGLRSNETMVAHAVLDIALKAAAEIAWEKADSNSDLSTASDDYQVGYSNGAYDSRCAILALTSEGTKP